jgi:hypothetical protein
VPEERKRKRKRERGRERERERGRERERERDSYLHGASRAGGPGILSQTKKNIIIYIFLPARCQ